MTTADELHKLYYIGERLGHGTYGVVVAGTLKLNNKKIALKCARPSVSDDTSISSSFLREINFLAQLKECPYIVNMLSYHILKREEKYSEIIIVMPLCNKNSLSKLTPDINISAEKWILEITHALIYSHAKGIVHLDISLSNILIHDDSAFLTDFGMAMSIDEIEKEPDFYVNVRYYRAPELLTSNTVGPSCDIWSLGCVFACLLSLKYENLFRFLWTGIDSDDQLLKIIDDSLDDVSGLKWLEQITGKTYMATKTIAEHFPNTPKPLLILLQQMLKINPAERASLLEIKNYLKIFISQEQNNQN